MKKKWIVLVMVFSCGFGKAQGLGNFFSQKEADIKYMLAQIAELQTYTGFAEDGYSIAQKGLTAIGDFKKGEFDLHNTFFTSLSIVNPAVQNYSRVAAIISYQISIISSFKKILHLQYMTASELNYLQNVYKNMSAACTKSLNELIAVIRGKAYIMKDNERIERIDAIYADTKDKYAFTQSFSNDVLLLSLQRQRELNDIDFEKKLN